MSYKHKTVRYFDEHAASTRLTGRLFDIKMRIIRQNVGKDDVILDAGCGNGELAVPLSKFVKRIYAVDISPGMLKELKTKLRSKRIKNCTPMHADLGRVPLKAGSVDVVISFATLYYIKELSTVLKELRRVCKPGSIMVLEVFNGKSFEASYSKRNFDVPQFHSTFRQYEQMLKRQGLFLERVHHLQLLPNVLVPKWVDTILGLKAGNKTIDELISSLPLLRRYAMKFIFVVRVA
jgi:ubiquinone/menaquinone biosynthesis C-methylase UbiE